jgi:hypothetical protein
MGERTVRFTQGGEEWVDVCALCTEQADEHGWIREGTPTTPLVPDSARRRRRFGGLSALLESRKTEPEPVVSEPVLRRLSPPEQAMVESAELFNDSAYRRTIAGIAKSLGEARVSLLPLSGTNPEVVITVAWDISWYQYRVVFDSAQPVRLAERGYEVDDLDDRFKSWNGSLGPDGRLSPDIPRLEGPPKGLSRRRQRAVKRAAAILLIRDDILGEPSKIRRVIYCVIPPELEDELFDKLVEYYKDNPNVEVIVDRRTGPDRRRGKEAGEFKDQRKTRDRRRPRIPGTFPDTDVPEEAA